MRIGIIAGSGELPQLVIDACKRLNHDYFVLAIENITEKKIVEGTPHKWLHLGQIGKAIKNFQKNGIEKILMIGRVGRPSISALKLDFSGLKLLSKLSKLKSQGDDEVFSEIIKFFERSGFEVIGVEKVLAELMMPAGVIGQHVPDDIAWNDIRIGMKAATEIGKLDIGQAVVIQHGQILGVEGAEGTDKLMNRCKELHNEGNGGVLVKMKKPAQDSRVDLPSIGVKTIENAHSSGLRGIAVEAGSALILNKEKVITRADELGMFVVGVNPLETV